MATGGTQRSRWSVRVVRGRSMLPTLRDGDRLLVRDVRAGDPAPAAGSLVVVRLPGDRPEAVKRLAGRHHGGWWVERDNPADGVDSWLVGAIPQADLRGVVRARLWPRPRRFRPGRAPGP
ncbi:MAG TPA: S26 family signal peptidase [Kineosporiaceae bacterium]